MIYGVVGSLDFCEVPGSSVYRPIPKTGNGKTCTCVYIAHREKIQNNRRIIANFHVTFADKYLQAQQIFDGLNDLLDLTAVLYRMEADQQQNSPEYRELKEEYDALYNEFANTVFILSELQKWFKSLGTGSSVTAYVENACTQLRKINSDFLYDTQRPQSVHVRLRDYTNVYLQPFKIHKGDLTYCEKDNCSREHWIVVYSAVPPNPVPLYYIAPERVGKFYDCKEIIGDILE